MDAKKEFIAKFKSNQPIQDCLGSTGGRFKWLRVMDCIDLRYGHDTRQSAVYHRHKAALEAWSMDQFDRELVPCHCGKMAQRREIDALGECNECSEKR